MKILKILVIFIISLNTFCSTTQACRWCFAGRVPTLVEHTMRLKEEEIPFVSQENNVQEVPEKMHLLPSMQKPTEQGEEFYQESIYTYYPKAFVMRERYFANMCPEALDTAFKEIVRVLAHDTWFYFTNDQRHFRWSAHWQRIIKILKSYKQFINKAVVFLDTLSVHELSYYDRYIMQRDNKKFPAMQILEQYWQEKGFTAYQDFLALYFDYSLKFFNEGIKFKDKKKVEKSYSSLARTLSHLHGTKYQANYEDAFARCKRLRELLNKEGEIKKQNKAMLNEQDCSEKE